MYKRLDERRLDCARLAPGRVPVRRLPRPSLSIHVKIWEVEGESAGEGKERKKVELADLLSFGEWIKRRVAKVSVLERNSSFALQ